MVTERLTYFLESKCLFSSYQNGFSRGKNAMDALLCLQSEIRKAQTNMFNRLDLRGGGISGCRMSQALRICSDAFKSPVTAMQVKCPSKVEEISSRKSAMSTVKATYIATYTFKRQ